MGNSRKKLEFWENVNSRGKWGIPGVNGNYRGNGNCGEKMGILWGNGNYGGNWDSGKNGILGRMELEGKWNSRRKLELWGKWEF